MRGARHVETYVYDVTLQCRDCGALNGTPHSPGGHVPLLERTAARHIAATDHTVEVIESRVRAYGPKGD
jgi:hypothetical protein